MSGAGAGAPAPLLVSEVFSAIQGEAALVGERQVFVRLTGCTIRCRYCDQPEALELRPGPCRMEVEAGRRRWDEVASPVDVGDVVAAVDRLWYAVPHHSVSLTGGEPLMQGARVVPLLDRLATSGRDVMLETNGTLVTALDRVVDLLTYVSMDVKLPSVDGERVDPDVQRRFLARSLAAGLRTWVKVVVGPATDLAEFDRAVAMVAGEAEAAGVEVELFLQPLTPFGPATSAPGPDQVLDLQARALRRHARVRVVPQTHKAIGQL